MSAPVEQPPKLVLLLGAGASVAARVPATVEFVDEFLGEKRSDEDLVEVIMTLRTANRDADVEKLLSVLHNLAHWDDAAEHIFLKRPPDFPSSEKFSKWALELETFIRERCFVPPDRIDYLEPLRSLLANYRRPLDVFTVNYDTTVEVFCLTRNLQFNNGFRGIWRPDVLEEEETDLRLYKIHGSVTWWATDQGTIVEIPVKILGPETQLYYGARARTAVIYPYTPTKGLPQPALDLLPLLRKRLLDSDLLVSAGYSFRDDEIRDIAVDAMRQNRKLALILIGPSAQRIYEARLKWSASGVESAASTWTSLLPFRFEFVLPNLQDRILRNVLHGLERYRELLARQVKYAGEIPASEWAYAADSLAMGGLVELATDALYRSDSSDWPFEYHLRLMAHLTAMVEWSGITGLLQPLEKLYEQFVSRLEAAILLSESGDRVVLGFDFMPGKEGPRDASIVNSWFREAEHWLGRTAVWTADPNRALVDGMRTTAISRGLRGVAQYIEKYWPRSHPFEEIYRRWRGVHAERWEVLGILDSTGLSKQFKGEVAKELSKAEGARFAKAFREGPLD